MMTPALSRSLILASLLAAAPAAVPAQEQEPPPPPNDIRLATINGTEYDMGLFRAFMAQRMRETRSQNTPEFQQQAFNEFITVVVAAQEAAKRDLGEQENVQTALEMQRLMILSNAAMQSLAGDAPPTDDELKQAYEDFKTQAQRTEYKARHILVDDKAKAEDLIKQIDKKKGKNFETLAEENSLGPTAEKGGDLGWFDARQMVKPFADAVAALEPGSWTEQPVQTQFGWHVILLEETRDAQPPSFDEAKPNLTAAVQQRKVAEALSELRKNADIDLNEEVVQVSEADDG